MNLKCTDIEQENIHVIKDEMNNEKLCNFFFVYSFVFV